MVHCSEEVIADDDVAEDALRDGNLVVDLDCYYTV